MASLVNLDALIPREDFEVLSDKEDAPVLQNINVRSLDQQDFFYQALRKPDFQRETYEWDPKRVAGLVRTFIEGDLIPSVILWKNRGLLFVIDGSHRLSALIAWVQDDYGDGPLSQEFFNHTIPDDQLKYAKRTREMIHKEIGSYVDHLKAAKSPDSFGPDIVARARALGSRALTLQWVQGDATKAEDSFTRINQQAAMITPQELELIKGRRFPNTIAARAIIRRGTGHQYWSAFKEEVQDELRKLATNLHSLLFEPYLGYPIKTLDLPAGGAVYSASALRMVYDFVNLCVGVSKQCVDEDGKRTIEYLKRCQRVVHLLISNKPQSLGLHPAVYFYSWTGKQQPIVFLTLAQLFIDFERDNKLPIFIEHRVKFEDFLVHNRPLVSQVVRKYGTKTSGTKHLRDFYDTVLSMIAKDIPLGVIPSRLVKSKQFSYLQPEESPYDGVTPTRYSTQVKSGLIINELLPSAPRCSICGGLVPFQAISIDHKVRREDGGQSTIDNAQLTHPYCNTGYKECLVAKEKKSKG